MAYIGKRPSDTFRSIAAKDTFTGDGSTTTFDITNAAASANDLMVFVDNVRQEPGSGKSYTLAADGSGLLKRVTFDAAPDASAEIYVINPHLAPEAVASAQNLESRAFTNQSAETSVANDDLVLIYDTSAGAVRKMTKSLKGIGITMVALGLGPNIVRATTIANNLKHLGYDKTMAVSRLKDIPNKVINLLDV